MRARERALRRLVADDRNGQELLAAVIEAAAVGLECPVAGLIRYGEMGAMAAPLWRDGGIAPPLFLEHDDPLGRGDANIVRDRPGSSPLLETLGVSRYQAVAIPGTGGSGRLFVGYRSPGILDKEDRSFLDLLAAKAAAVEDEAVEQGDVRDASEAAKGSEKQRHYATMLGSTSTLVSMISRDYVYLAVNDPYRRFFGRPRAEIEGRRVDSLHGKMRFEEHIKPVMDASFESGRGLETLSWISRFDGEQRLMESRQEPVLAADGEVEAVVITSRDITRQTRLQEVMMDIAVSESTRAGAILEVGQMVAEGLAEALSLAAAEVWLSTKAGEPLRSVWRCGPEGDHDLPEPLALEAFPDVNSTWVSPLDGPRMLQEAPQSRGSVLYAAIRVSGQILGLLVLRNATPRHWSDAERFLVKEIAGQISHAVLNRERRELEERLALARKRESLGILAGGIAHDFNNLLVSILGGIDLALSNLPADFRTREDLELALAGAQRASDLVHQMLAFAGKAHPQPQPLDLNQELQATVRVMRARLASNVVAAFRLSPLTLMIEADPAQLHQVMMNLLVNASDAYRGEAGIVRIRSGVMELDPGPSDLVVQPSCEVRGMIFFEIEDMGCGMGAEVQARMFDPFFSTKPNGRGLGLAAVVGIVEAHRGGIWIESEVGRGTRVRVAFQVSEKALPELVSRAGTSQQADLRVLVVEKGFGTRKVIRKMLERGRFQVLVVEPGEAMETLERELPAALVVEVSTAGRDGLALVEEVHRRGLDLPILVVTSLAPEELASRWPGERPPAVLQKPFRISRLVEAVRSVIESRA